VLEATLGMINIEQNNIIKIFSVAAVVFLPPTLVASLYGMNFDFMPELHWRYGYEFALAMMAAVAAGIGLFFRHKGWIGGDGHDALPTKHKQRKPHDKA
jgi:magnesium transporter